MALLVSFTVPGRLKGKGRARSMIMHGKAGQQFVHHYTPKDTTSAEAMVRDFAHKAMQGRAPFQGPLIVRIDIVWNKPVSWSKAKKAAAAHVTGKPDLDNVMKLVGDALNGIVWPDDSMICEMQVRRRYDDSQGEHARILVSSPADPVRVEQKRTEQSAADPLFEGARAA